MELDELRAFLAVAQAGNISAASRASGLARSTLRRRVASLEGHLRSTLLDGDGQSLVLTSRGRVLAARARELLDLAADVEATVTGVNEEMAGTITAFVPVGTHPQAAALVGSLLVTRHPGIRLQLVFSVDPIADMAREGDLAVVLAPAVAAGPWIARRLGAVPVRLIASAPYLAAWGTPSSVEGLAAHRVICNLVVAPSGCLPTLDGGTVAVASAIESNDLHFCRCAALAGHGLALAPTPKVPGSDDSGGEAVVVLGDRIGTDLPVWLVAPGGLSRRPLVAPVVEDVLAFLQEMDVGVGRSR